MIVGFGCNVPAVMAARTLANRRDRVLTILMMPFMSCGARLAMKAPPTLIENKNIKYMTTKNIGMPA